MGRWNLTIIILIACICGSTVGQQKSKNIDLGNVEAITTSQLKDYLSFIASDELEGRDTPSRGLNIAAKFIATHLSRWGLKPVGDSGSYFQSIELRRTKVVPSETFVEINGKRFSFGTDFISNAVNASVTAPLVFVKNGIILKSKNINPYNEIDVKGKIMVLLGGFPKGISFADFSGKQGEDWESAQGYAQKHGAKGIITIPSIQQLTGWERQRKNAVERGTTQVEKFIKPDEQSLPMITASMLMVDALFGSEKINGHSMNDRTFDDSIACFDLSLQTKVSINVVSTSESIKTQNLVAVLEGSDKKLKDEFVAFGAHYDHIGISSTPVNGDSINNGADDDGSGTVALMSLAETFAKEVRTKRSLLFVWHCGEEKGLWGSKYFVENPIIPLEKIIVQLNIDMIGRSKQDSDTSEANVNLSKKNEAFIIGSKMMSTELGELSEHVNKSFINLTFNYKFDDPKDPLRLFYRSDHYNYAKKNIPIIFYFDGLHEDYHRPSDEISKIDFEKYAQITRTVYVTGLNLANMPTRPALDKKLPDGE